MRNFKLLVLGLAAPMLLGGLWPSPAAAEFHSELSSTVVTGSQPASVNDLFTTDAGVVSCENTTYVGSMSGSTTNEIKVTPTYSGCTGTFGVSISTHMNGCWYALHDGIGGFDIICPAGKVIEFTAPGCVITYPTQFGVGAATWTWGGSGWLRKIIGHWGLQAIRYEEHNKGFFPTCKSNTVAKSNGGYHGAAELTGENASGKQSGIWVE